MIKDAVLLFQPTGTKPALSRYRRGTRRNATATFVADPACLRMSQRVATTNIGRRMIPYDRTVGQCAKWAGSAAGAGRRRGPDRRQGADPGFVGCSRSGGLGGRPVRRGRSRSGQRCFGRSQRSLRTGTHRHLGPISICQMGLGRLPASRRLAAAVGASGWAGCPRA